MKDFPSKEELRELASEMRPRMLQDDEGCIRAPDKLDRVADVLYALAENQPEKREKPKEDSCLLLCPFCGYNGVEIKATIVLPIVYWGECKSCHALGPKRVIESEAPTAWNRRAEDARREEPKVKSLREVAKRMEHHSGHSYGEDAADLCAIVLRRVDRVWEWLDTHEAGDFAGSSRARDIKHQRAEID